MFTASLATVIIVIAMACIFLRYGRRNFALSILPLTVTPVFYAIADILAGYFFKSEILKTQVVCCVLLASVVVAGIFFGICTLMFKNKKTKSSYLVLCGGFTLVFALVLLINTMPKI